MIKKVDESFGQEFSVNDNMYSSQSFLSDSQSFSAFSDAGNIKPEKVKAPRSRGSSSSHRQRLTQQQLSTLENAFLANQKWPLRFMKDMARNLGLKHAKVYKWHWDRLKKAAAEADTSVKVD